MRVLAVRRLTAVLALAALGFTAACSGSDAGSGSGSDGGGGRKPKTSAGAGSGAREEPGPADAPSSPAGGEDQRDGPTRALSEAELDKVAITTSDTEGYTVRKPSAAEVSGAGEGTAHPSRCDPIAALIMGVPRPEPSAVVYRQLGSKRQSDDRAGVILFEILSSHEANGARRAIRDMRGAVSDCAGGFAIKGGEGAGAYVAVKALPEPEVGGDAVAFQVMGDLEGQEVPMVFTVVRRGSVLATFYSMNLMDETRADVPAHVVQAQADKLSAR